MSEQETQETLKVEEIINVLRNMEEAFRKERIEELRNIKSYLTNILACLDYPLTFCRVEIHYLTYPEIVIGSISGIINGSETVDELRNIIKTIIVKNSHKLIVDILEQINNIIEKIIDGVEKEEDP